MYLNGEDESKDMYLYINSPGGAVLAGISVYDAMQFVVPDVHTICMGLAASMEYGASSIIVCYQKNQVTINSDILLQNQDGREVQVRLGEKVGERYVE